MGQIVNGSTNKNASRLATAMKGWNSSVYKQKPDGVFGAIAIIRRGDSVKISSEELDIEFTVPFDDDMEANEAEIVIYNLSSKTIQKLEKNKSITIEAGFGNDYGTIFSGYIKKRKTEWDGVEKITTLTCTDRLKTTKVKAKTYKKKTKAKKILKDLLKQTKTPIAVFKPVKDYVYKDEQKVSGDLYENITKYADVCGISVYVNKGKIYARKMAIGDDVNFTVSVSTGMINTPSSFSETITSDSGKQHIKGYEVEMLLQHRITTASIIRLKSKNAKNGKYRVKSGTHSFDSSGATTTVKVY